MNGRQGQNRKILGGWEKQFAVASAVYGSGFSSGGMVTGGSSYMSSSSSYSSSKFFCSGFFLCIGGDLLRDYEYLMHMLEKQESRKHFSRNFKCLFICIKQFFVQVAVTAAALLTVAAPRRHHSLHLHHQVARKRRKQKQEQWMNHTI